MLSIIVEKNFTYSDKSAFSYLFASVYCFAIFLTFFLESERDIFVIKNKLY